MVDPDRVNPYQPPPMADEATSGTSGRATARGGSLPTWSLFLAVALLPLEADLLFGPPGIRMSVPACLLLMTGCLALILAPLVVYTRQNGWPGIVRAKGRILLVGFLILLKLWTDWAWLTHGSPYLNG